MEAELKQQVLLQPRAVCLPWGVGYMTLALVKHPQGYRQLWRIPIPMTGSGLEAQLVVLHRGCPPRCRGIRPPLRC